MDFKRVNFQCGAASICRLARALLTHDCHKIHMASATSASAKARQKLNDDSAEVVSALDKKAWGGLTDDVAGRNPPSP